MQKTPGLIERSGLTPLIWMTSCFMNYTACNELNDRWPICVMRNKIVIDTQERRNKSHVGVTSASRYTALLDYFDLLTADTYQLNSCSCFLKFIVRHWCNRVQCFTQLRARLNNFGVLWVTSNFSQSYSSTKRDLGCQLGATNAGLHKGI